MNKLTLFHTIAYESAIHQSGTPHFMNDTEFFGQFYSLVMPRDADAIDLGFNIGIQADMLLSLTEGTVYGFEASRRIFDFAVEKYRGNDRVKLFHCAVTNTSGAAQFYDAAVWGAGSLRVTAGMRSTQAGDAYQLIPVELKRLDDVLGNHEKIGIIKLDIEGAEILALDGARRLLHKNRPYMVMEYSHNALAFEFRGKPIDKNTLYDFSKEIGYTVYNIYGICLKDRQVWDTSIFRDTADVYLIPDEEHVRWVTELLPRYQYGIFDKISETIEWNEKGMHYYGLACLPSRIYEVLNTSGKAASFDCLAREAEKLRRSLRDRAEIFQTAKLSRRGEVLLALVYDRNLEAAYQLGMKKELEPGELVHFEKMII
jgi:FkbM family methyltransferase